MFLALVVFLPTYSLNAQVQQPQGHPPNLQNLTPQQQQQLSNCPPGLTKAQPPLLPGSFEVCPGAPLLPAGARAMQIPIPDSVVRQHFNAVEAVLNKVKQEVAQHPGTTAAQVLQNMTDQGLINCP